MKCSLVVVGRGSLVMRGTPAVVAGTAVSLDAGWWRRGVRCGRWRGRGLRGAGRVRLGVLVGRSRRIAALAVFVLVVWSWTDRKKGLTGHGVGNLPRAGLPVEAAHEGGGVVADEARSGR
jgi:hypothetical protein